MNYNNYFMLEFSDFYMMSFSCMINFFIEMKDQYYLHYDASSNIPLSTKNINLLHITLESSSKSTNRPNQNLKKLFLT